MSNTLQALLEQVGPSTTKATVRSHVCYVDRPVDKGGEDRGPAGGEYQLVALAGCFSSHLLAAIRAREALVTGLRVTASGVLDDHPQRFTEFGLAVSAKCDDAGLLHKLVAIAERGCQVTNTLKRAAPVTITIEAVAEAAAN
jgi:putative redox protein